MRVVHSACEGHVRGVASVSLAVGQSGPRQATRPTGSARRVGAALDRRQSYVDGALDVQVDLRPEKASRDPFTSRERPCLLKSATTATGGDLR